MEKFGYVIKSIYHTPDLNEVLSTDDIYENEEGGRYINNYLEFLYQECREYENISYRLNISVSEFILKSNICYIIYELNKTSVVIKHIRLSYNNHRICVKLLRQQEIPQSTFPTPYIYITECVYGNRVDSDWNYSIEKLIQQYKNISFDYLYVIKIHIHHFHTEVLLEGLQLRTQKLINRYMNSVTSNIRDWCNFLLRVSDNDIYQFDGNLQMIYKRSWYMGPSNITSDDLIDYDIYQYLINKKKKEKPHMAFLNYLMRFCDEEDL